MTTNSLDSLEERIQKPGYLLFLVVVLLLLIVGFVDLIDYVAEVPVILGRYGVRYFAVMIGYTLFMLAWASLLLKPNDDHLLAGALNYIQMRPPLAVGFLGVMGVFVLAMINAANTVEGAIMTLPAFQVTVLALALLFSGIILLYKWGDQSRPQRWRKVILIGLGIILVVELILQVTAYFGAFPTELSTTQSFDRYSPYNRIYYTEEGFGNGLTNNYGRYAPDFKLLADSQRIAVLGDSFVEGLQVRSDQNFGVLLEERLAANNTGEQVAEVLPLGYPDIGPGLYLSRMMLTAMIRAFEPDEAIVFFDLGSDLQTVDRAGLGVPFFVYRGQGKAEIDSSHYWRDLHEIEHSVFRSYKGIQPVLILKSNYLTARLIGDRIAAVLGDNGESGDKENQVTNYEVDLPNGFAFNEQTSESAMQVASAQINMAKAELDRAGVDTRLVVNPVFTDAFYEQETWNTVFGDSDLLLPERQLREVAAHFGVPFLGLGTYMEAQGMSPADVQELYFDEGRGRLTPAGHEFVAEAIYQCFFAQSISAQAGCELP